MQSWPIGRQILISGMIVVVGALGWYAHAPAVAYLAQQGWIAPANEGGKRRGRRGRGDRATPVIVARVTTARNDDAVVAVGTGRAIKTATFFPQIEGFVSAVEVRAGDRVKAGDVILRLDKSKAELAVQIARQRLALADKTLERAKFLQRRRVQSNAKGDDAQIAVGLARLELEQAKEALADTKIRAPFAGVVSLPEVELGDRVTPSTRIASLDDRSTILIEFSVPENFFTRMGPGTPVTATTPAIPGRTFAGKLRTIDPRIDTATRTVRVRAAIANDKDLLRPGMSFTAKLNFTGRTHISVPELALQYDDGQPFVWRVVDGAAAKVKVTMVRRLNDTALVDGAVARADLARGDLVIVEGVQRVREGRPVKFDALPPVTDTPAPVASSEINGPSVSADGGSGGVPNPLRKRPG